MKFLTALSIILIAAIKMADLGAPTALLNSDTQRPTTLFSVTSNYDDLSSQDTELWETSIYQTQGIETQVRWSKDGSFISAAKSCTVEGKTVVAQVTMDLEAPRVQHSVVETQKGPCEITLGHTDDNSFFIQDKDLIFTGENADGSVELSVMVDSTETADALFSKVAG